MAFREYKKLAAKAEELDELYQQIIKMKDELKEIKSLAEYNELAEKINQLVDEYNEKREEVKNAL